MVHMTRNKSLTFINVSLEKDWMPRFHWLKWVFNFHQCIEAWIIYPTFTHDIVKPIFSEYVLLHYDWNFTDVWSQVVMTWRVLGNKPLPDPMMTRLSDFCKYAFAGLDELTHPPWTKWPPCWQTIFSDVFFLWMTIFVFWLKFHWSLFQEVQLTITQHWFR